MSLINITHQRYRGDASGTRYDYFRDDRGVSPWTVVVCEDRPQLYTELLRQVVADGMARAAMSVPFRVASLNLLQCGWGRIDEQDLTIHDSTKCIVILDQDADPQEWDIPGAKPARREFTGPEFFKRLPSHQQQATYRSSRLATRDAPPDYLERYPEQECVPANAHHEIKESEVAVPQLAEGAKKAILRFIREHQRQRERGP